MVAEERSLLKDNHIVTSDYGTIASRPASVACEERGEMPKWDEAVASGMVHTTYKRELIVLVRYTLPLYVTFLLQYSLTFASLFSAGNLGKDELAAVLLATMTANITGYAVYQGLSTSLDTLCAQAYGSGNKTLIGLHLQRMVCFLMCITVPVIIIWLFSEQILTVIIPEPELAVLAGRYLRILTLGAPGYACFEAGKRFVQAQGNFTASTYVLLFCAPFNAIMNYILVWHPKYGFGFSGAPTAVVITDWMMPLLLFLYVRFVDGYDCWGGFTRKAFHNWRPMIKLSLPGLIIVEAEFIAFELLTLLSSYFDTAHLAAQSVIVTATSIAFQLPFALSIASSTRVANLLGATLEDGAKTAAYAGFIASIFLGIVNLLFIVSARSWFVLLLTQDPEVIGYVVSVMPITALFQCFDALASMGGGILRGQGRQHIGSYISIVAYYFLAIPISIIAAFVFGWELCGLWSGVAVALAFVAIIQTTIVLRTDWAKVVKDATARIEGA
ncbi:mate-domain-containing protein [Morchella snyderi]|nr:mate-domain-containing protein [Morchella snyderi]